MISKHFLNQNIVYLRKIHDVVQIEIRLYSGSRYL